MTLSEGWHSRSKVIYTITISTLVCLAGLTYLALRSPRVMLLVPQGGAQWIRLDRPIDLNATIGETTYTAFRVDCQVPAGFRGGVLFVRALRRVAVALDGKRIFDTGPHVSNWKTTYSIPIPPSLAVGTHLLKLSVANRDGPSLVLAYCDELGLHSSSQWLASDDGKRWQPAARADEWKDPDLANQFGPASYDLLVCAPLLIVLVVTGTVLSQRMFASRDGSESAVNWPTRLRWALMLALLILGINNLFKLPSYFGYDVTAHLDYIRYVAEKWRIPFPNEGWQMFQTPVYYVLSAILYRMFLLAHITTDSAAQMLCILPVMCGVGMVEICYRAGRYAFPNQHVEQMIATVVGGLLPMNLYMMPALSNEPMAACLAGAIACFAMAFIARPDLTDSPRNVVFCGLLLGVAILTKVSAILWILPVCAAVAFALNRRHATLVRSVIFVSIIPISLLGVTGSYFARNWIRMGTPFYSNSGGAWAQYPGYRTPFQLLEFGHVLTGPAYSWFWSFWDSVFGTLWADGSLSGMGDFAHRPPFHYSLMSCGMWLGLVPTIAIITMMVRLIWRAGTGRTTAANVLSPAVFWFAAASVGLFIIALVYVYLTLPIYSCAKASYMLGAAPCIAVLSAGGFAEIARFPMLRHVTTGLLFCWAVISYMTYFVF